MDKRFIDNYYCDINNLADTITKLTNSYRLMIGGADELNRITVARKKDLKDSLKRINKIGEIIDDYLNALDEMDLPYLEYCKIKSDFYKTKIKANFIIEEVEEGLKTKK